MMPYERFDAWKAAHQLVLLVYEATRQWPSDERFGLTAQLRRAAMSAPLNIAEGSAKRGRAEFRRFLDIALGSLSEVAYALRLGHDLGYLGTEEWQALEAQRASAGKLTWRLYESVARPSA